MINSNASAVNDQARQANALSTAPDHQVVDNKCDLLYEQVAHIDADVDFDFNLKASGYNPMVQLSNPLLLLALRLKKIQSIEDIQGLYDRVANEIVAVTEAIRSNSAYDMPMQLSFRYCLCTFIDEIVMSTEWGKSSIWAQGSLLARFHDETWGGEKFYSILSRLMLEADKYKDLLEFMYLCLTLGYQGQYALHREGSATIQNLILTLHTQLRELRGEVRKQPMSIKTYSQDYEFSEPVAMWKVVSGVVGMLVSIFLLYKQDLEGISASVLEKLDLILR